jgi:putative FmdB family regulatory protein
MPRFDFHCKDCEERFEHLLNIGAPPPLCLQCGSSNVQKLLAPPPVIFKGSGFFKTDSTKTARMKEEPKKEEKKVDPKPEEKKSAQKPESGK